MLKKLFLVVFLISFTAQSQNVITGEMNPLNDGFAWVAMYRLKGSKQVFIKNVTIENGAFAIEMPANSPKGMYRIRYKMDNVSFINIIYTNENISFNFDPNNPAETLTFSTSEENKIYNSYQKQATDLKQELSAIQMAFFKQTSEKDQSITQNLYSNTLKEFHQNQQQYEKISTGKLANHFIKASNKYFEPILFKSPQEFLNSEKKHFFDFIDFNDSELNNSTFIIENVLSYVMYLNVSEDTQVQNALYKNAINEVMEKVTNDFTLKSELIITLMNTFSQTENLDLMNYLLYEYYNKLPESVKNEKDVKMIFDKVKLAAGKIAPDFTYKENGVTKSFHKLNKSDTYILVFWSTSCSHCIAEIPQLYEYTKNKTDLHVVNVGLEKNADDYNKYAAKFTNWTNVLGLGKWDNPIGRKYEIVNTPTYFILDANKKIIAKPDFLKDVKAFFEE